MKAATLLAVFAVTFLACVAAKKSTARVKNVAVVETEVDAQSGASDGLSPAEVRQVTAELRREAVKNLPRDKYNIMTSETVIAQGGAVLEECADENCVIVLGSKVGADYIVRGTISKLQTKFTLSVEMYETENGNLVASSDPVRSENVAELLEKTAAICADMYRVFVNPRSSKRRSAQPAPPSKPTVATQPAETPLPQFSAGVLGTFIDNRDGKKYKTTTISGKTWMAENLNYDTPTGSWCYGDDRSNCGKYGRLYDWITAKKACPSGWRLPTTQEWGNLAKAVGGSATAGKKLKAESGWSDYRGRSGDGIDSYGFSALPGGYRYSGGKFGSVEFGGLWWTATEYGELKAVFKYMDYYDHNISEGASNQEDSFSVRCVKE